MTRNMIKTGNFLFMISYSNKKSNPLLSVNQYPKVPGSKDLIPRGL